MYKEFYGLREMPFNVTPDPKFLFLSPTHQEALASLLYGIQERKGFIVLTGEVGCGKTTLCRHLLNHLDNEKYETALILNPRLSETQMLRAIMIELGHEPENSENGDLHTELNKLLIQKIHEGKDIVLIIDESQNLSFEALEHVRLLSNLETDSQKLLQMILMGQSELKEKLRQKRLRQLRQRILVYFDLRALSFDDMLMYIQHRLSLAGSKGSPRFTYFSLKSIHRRTKGVPRMINNLCDKAILSAYVRNSDVVNYWDVRRAALELSLT